MDAKKPLSQWSLHDAEALGWQIIAGLAMVLALLFAGFAIVVRDWPLAGGSLLVAAAMWWSPEIARAVRR